jgi:predicted DNA-binding protein (MmcQ/YjbR family)
VIVRLRSICLRLPDSYEEEAWVGTRWMVRHRNFAHVLAIEAGRPQAYASAAGSRGPLVVMTFRTSNDIYEALCDASPRFFPAVWGTRWGTKVVGMRLDRGVDWDEVRALVVESYRLLAPRKLLAHLE